MSANTLRGFAPPNVFNATGTPKLRRADASSIATRAHGFVKTAAIEGATVKFYESGAATGFSGLTIGATYFLSDSAPGEAAATAPTASGHIAQIVGVAVSATEIQIDVSEQPVVRA